MFCVHRLCRDYIYLNEHYLTIVIFFRYVLTLHSIITLHKWNSSASIIVTFAFDLKSPEHGLGINMGTHSQEYTYLLYTYMYDDALLFIKHNMYLVFYVE